MRKIVQRFLTILVFFGLGAFSTFVAATLVALWHIVNTPQPLESVLPGNAHIYRWRRGHIFYKTLGNEDAPPLVLLHAPGIGASAYEMRKIMQALAQHYHVYALDLLGFGLSDFRSKLMQQPVAGFLLYAILSTRGALRSKVARQHSPHQGQISESDVEYLYATTHQFGAEYAVMAELAGKLAVDASQQFEALRQPTLVIWGARALNNTNTQAITSQENMPAQTEIALMPDAGTFVHEEYPALVIANILGWREEGKTATARVKRPVVEKPATEESGTSETEPETEEALMTYCVKCKKKTPMQDAQEVTMKNGNPAIKGKCSICGTGQFRMGRLSKETI